jgi:hypothetical protein
MMTKIIKTKVAYSAGLMKQKIIDLELEISRARDRLDRYIDNSTKGTNPKTRDKYEAS